MYPHVPGFEGSGTVALVHANAPAPVKDLVGKNVAFLGFSTWAEFVAVDINLCMPLPENIGLEQGANSFVNPWTAVAMHERAKELGAKAIIITAAGSQLGIMSIKLALRDGIIPICTVRRAEAVQQLKSEIEGLNYVFDTSDPE